MLGAAKKDAMKRYTKTLTGQKKLLEEHASFLLKKLINLNDRYHRAKSLPYKSELFLTMKEIRKDLACIEEPLLKQHPFLQELFDILSEE